MTLIQAIDRSRYEPLVVLHQAGPLSAFLDDLGLDYELLPLRRTVGRSRTLFGHLGAITATLPTLVSFLRHRQVALVHSNDARMHLTWTLPARLAGAVALWHQRNRVSGSRLEALMLRGASRVIAISQFVAAGLPPGLRAKARVIANPVAAPETLDREACRDELLRELGLGPDTAVIGLFGNLIAWKRPLLFVETAAHLTEILERPPAFVVFGEDREGLQAGMAERAAELGLSGRLFFMGFRRPVWPWMASCDVLVAPARDEPFGRTLVEAMLCGTAVVASDAGGHREIIQSGRDGLLVPGDDPAGYAEAAARLLDDAALRQSLVERGREKAIRLCDAASHAAAVTALYDDCLGRQARPEAEAGLLLVIADLDCGGAQRVLTRLAKAWHEAGRAVTVVTLAGPDRDFFALEPGIRRVALGLQSPSRGLLAALWSNSRRVLALRRAIRDSGAGSVLSFVAGTNILTILATRGLGCRLVISERNDPARQSLGGVWDWLRRRVYAWADRVTANSAGAIETLHGYVPAERLALVPNPLVVPEDVAARPASPPTILSVGRLNRQKGHDLLLQAFAVSEAARRGWRLAFLGDGPLAGALAAQAERLGIAEQVEWRGWSDAPFDHYKGAEIFALASRFEGTPNAVLEAMAMGLPAIVTDGCGGALDYVEHERSGLVVPREDVPALTEAIDRLVEDESLRRRLAENASRRLEASNLDRCLMDWNALLFSLEGPAASA